MSFECIAPIAEDIEWKLTYVRARPLRPPGSRSLPSFLARTSSNCSCGVVLLPQVGSAESDDHDQLLDSVLVGPMQVGGYKIVFQADPPDPRRIPTNDLLGVTVVLLSCFYREREFIRVGYYVNSE